MELGLNESTVRTILPRLKSKDDENQYYEETEKLLRSDDFIALGRHGIEVGTYVRVRQRMSAGLLKVESIVSVDDNNEVEKVRLSDGNEYERCEIVTPRSNDPDVLRTRRNHQSARVANVRMFIDMQEQHKIGVITWCPVVVQNVSAGSETNVRVKIRGIETSVTAPSHGSNIKIVCPKQTRRYGKGRLIDVMNFANETFFEIASMLRDVPGEELQMTRVSE